MTTPLFSPRDRVVAVTGGATGIGRAVALAFATRGARVIICGRRAARLEDAVAAFEEQTTDEPRGELAAHPADVSHYDDLSSVGDEAVRRWGRLDVWINNAGISERGVLPEADSDHLDRLLAVNVKGVFNGCRVAVSHMSERGGVILNISSYLAGHAGASAGLPAYSASKGAVSSLTRSLAVRHGPDRIRVNAICPALILTDLNREIWEEHEDLEARREELGERYPLRRVGRPEDVAAAALFLASEEAGWITGQELYVDGGITAQ